MLEKSSENAMKRVRFIFWKKQSDQTYQINQSTIIDHVNVPVMAKVPPNSAEYD